MTDREADAHELALHRKSATRGWALGGALLVVGCSLGSDDVNGDVNSYGLFPSAAHSGHNPQGSFRVLFATSAPNPQWAVADSSIATMIK